MNLMLAAPVLEEVIGHARKCYPKEGCGLIAGSGPAHGARFIPMTNALDSETAFDMAPQELIEALRRLREKGEQLTAIYHSHPHGPARPSKRDIEQAYYPKSAYLIVSLADLDRPSVAAFRISDGEVIEIEVHAIV